MFNPLTIQPFDVDDFSGGITDNYLDGDINRYQDADNFLITDNKKLITRGGSQIADSSHYLPGSVGTNLRTNLIFVFEDILFEQQAQSLYYNSSGYTTLTGPSGNALFSSGGSGNRTAWAYWNHHVILANDSLCKPQKMYKDSTGVFRVRTAGLPSLASSPTLSGSNQKVFDFANDLKAKYNAHLADTTQHTTAADSTNTITASNATNLSSLVTLVTQMLTKYTSHEADSQKSSGWSYHKAKATASRQLASVIAPVTIADCVTRLTDLKSNFNNHENDGTTHGVAGLHQETLANPAVRTFIYAFCYTYQYMVGTVTFKDFGPTTLVQITNVDAPSDNAISISSIPSLSNGTTDNYDTSVITCEIYRTIDSGQTLFYVGNVTNGTTSYSDTATDTTVQTSTVLYTDGGVYDNDPPPKAKYVTVANDICWYAHVQEGSEVHTNRVRQSIKFDPDSCPISFNIDMEDEITGIGNINIYPIVFCKQRIYRLEGFYDLTGNGFINKVEISRVVGCTSHQGIVITLEGIFFPGNDGFYWTDGYSVQKISREINTRYYNLVNKQNICGTYDPTFKRIYWGVQLNASSGDNDAFLIADLKFGVKPDTPFTTASADSSFAPTSLCMYNSNLYRADKRGYLFQHLDTLQTDPKIDTLSVPTAWHLKTIIYNYVSCASAFGNHGIRKWVPKMVLHAKNVSNVTIGINSYNDDSPSAKSLKEIRLLSNIIWGDPTISWGDATIIWNYSTLIKANRNFPAGGLRCDYKQLQFTNSYTIITNSDSLGTATVDSHAKTVTLETAPNNIWPNDAVDYYVSFSDDLYTVDYLITSRTDSVLTYSDPGNATLSGSLKKWIIRGYRKNDVLYLLNYTVFFGFISDTQDSFSKSETGANT